MFVRTFFHTLAACALLLATSSPVSAQEDGSGQLIKTAVGWVITLLLIGVGIGIVVRPTPRKEPKWKK